MTNIEKVYFLNIPRRLDKYYAAIGSLLTLGVPESCIERFPGEDASQYETNYDVCKAAIADGFTHFETMFDDEWLDSGHEMVGRGSLCCLWSMQKMHRTIADKNKTVIAMTDNYVLPYRFDKLNEIISPLSDLRVLQLSHWDKSLYSQIFPDSEIRQMDYYPNLHPRDDRLSIGLAGIGDTGLIVSQQGSIDTLKWCSEYPKMYVELMYWYVAKNKNTLGCYSLNYSHPKYLHCRIKLERFTSESDSERTKWN